MNEIIKKNMILTIILFTIIWITLTITKLFYINEHELIIKSIITYIVIISLIIFVFLKLSEYYRLLNEKNELLDRENRLFLNSPVILFRWPPTKNEPLKYVSNNISNILGYNKEDFLSGRIQYSDIIYKEDVKAILNEAANYTNDKDVTEFKQKYRLLKADNSVITVYDKTFIIRDIIGNVLYFDGYIIDITENLKMKQEIADKTNKLKDIEEIVGLGFWEYNLSNKSFYCSNGIYDILGLKAGKDTVTRELFLSKAHPDDREMIKKRYADILKNGSNGNRLEHRFIINNKIKYVLEYCNAYFENNKPVRFLGVMIDITKERELENELLRVKNLESLGIVAGGLAHNLNNLLAIIQGNLDLIETKDMDNLKNINSAILRGKELAQKMLIFADGGEPIKQINNNFPEILKKIINSIENKNNINFIFNYPKNNFQINIDIDMIRNAILNIIQNSINAFEKNNIENRSINIDIKIIDNFKKGNYLIQHRFLKLIISDNAGGISNKYKEKVLLPYFTTNDNNLGLGLTIVNTIVNKHDGYLYIKSEEYFGTEIIIYLPVIDEVSTKKDILNVLNEKIDLMENKNTKNNCRKVLIMDDEELILKMGKKFLEIKGYEVETATNGNEAIEIYKKNHSEGNCFQSVILDLSIPNGMGGEETARELLKIDRKCRLIVSSGYSNSDILSNYRKYGFVNYLPKPYKLDELLNVINNSSEDDLL